MLIKISGSNYITLDEKDGSIRSKGYLLRDQSEKHRQELLIISKNDLKRNMEEYSAYEKYLLIIDYIEEFEAFGEDIKDIRCNLKELENLLRENGYSVKYIYCRMIVEKIFE